MLRKIIHVIFVLGGLISPTVYAQTIPDTLHLERVRGVLDKIMDEAPQYNETMDISVNNVPVGDFLTNIAKVGRLNLNVQSDGEKRISCNFKKVRVADLVFFVCKNFDYDLDLTGEILSIYPYKPSHVEPVISMDYEPTQKKISYDFTQAKLVDMAKKFSELSGVNVIIPNSLSEERVSAYGNSMGIDDALQSIAATNKLTARKESEMLWSVFRQEKAGVESPGYFPMYNLEVDSTGLITAHMNGANIHDVVRELCQRLKYSYFFIDNLEHSTGISVEKVDFDSFLKILFTGTHFTWRVENGIYLFGRDNQGASLSSAHVVPMRYRAVDQVMGVIPQELKQGVEIIAFPDLNSLVLSGEQRRVIQLMSFLKEIDKSVLLVSIDVIILDATDTRTREAGISMGLGKEATITSGSLSPGINVTMGASSINKLINSFNGFGSINLGRVSPNFYFSLKLLEEDGKIILRSTPRLSTLNGHKATLKSGEMKYYKETQTYLTGTQNPIQSESYQWKNVEANLSLDITPYVSLDSCITMQIDLTQSEFTEREAEDAPPGKTTRSFNSIIKVRNEEMVLLGGLERNLSSRTSSGLPFLARVPVLRWIFGSSSKKKSVQKLNVFIKPTIIK